METDVLVIGGGATGGGIALDLALRGVRVVLAEMGDLATGTSGRYHGLLHSGARYAVRDPESARECIEENTLLRKLAPEAIEDTSGFFVLCPGDDVNYVDTWLKACATAGISTRQVPMSEALRREPTLNPKIEVVYEVPDGTCDSWDLLHLIQARAREAGAAFLTYHRVESFLMQSNRVVGAHLTDTRTGESKTITCALVVNAAGPWAAQVAALAGANFNMRLSRGAMLAYNIRWVNTVINKLRMPGDGDIFVPVGTVSVIGTTSVRTDDPGDVRVEPWEVTRILDEAEAMTPGISRARILRAWGGVRPLYDPGGDQRDAKRTFETLDHETRDGVAGIISIVGGKLTTYRLMAEKISDLAAKKLGVTKPSVTATTPLPSLHNGDNRLHRLRGRLDALEHGHHPGALICECEIVTQPQIVAALQSGDAHNLHDLRRDLRLGMGPCQGGFCTYRAAGIRHSVMNDTPAHTVELLGEFVERRFGGMRPLLWGHNLRQALLAEHIYGRILGLMGGDARQTPPLITPPITPKVSGVNKKRIVVIGAGLAGLTAAVIAGNSGAHVELIAQGQGAITLHPGWIEIGDVDTLAAKPHHPYAKTKSALETGLSALDSLLHFHAGENGTAINAITGLGSLRSIAYTVGAAYPRLDARKILVVGFIMKDGEGEAVAWRDFYPHLIADNLRARGYDADSALITLPHQSGNFDDWSMDIAKVLDMPEGRERLIRELKPKLNGAEVVAFPAILGHQADTRAAIASGLGVDILEVPTLTPSIPGLRVYHTLRRAILARGGRFTIGARAVGLDVKDGIARGVYAETAANGRPRWIPADAVIMATGGLFGGGLDTTYQGGMRESVADLTLCNVPPQSEWITHTLTGGQPQPIHDAGIHVDDQLRPLKDEAIFAANVYIAGRSLGGYAPVSEGSTEGVDIASGAFAALRAIGE